MSATILMPPRGAAGRPVAPVHPRALRDALGRFATGVAPLAFHGGRYAQLASAAAL
ncbi:MAG TPA: hypothetical protein VJM11_14795 [Nevskiaceae bacterium]|nr:hypothetical protein [Nevskiaceae bacterium]